MMAGSHVAVGVAAWVWAAPHLGFPTLDPVALALAIGGALLPDIDHPQSWVGRRIRVISHPLAALIGHRGFTHSVLAVVGCGLLLRWRGLGRAIVDPLVVGYLSHLAADLMTSGGLRLAWPSRRRFGIPLCKTGSPGELVIVVSLVVWVGATALGVRPAVGLEHLVSPSAWVHSKGTARSSPSQNGGKSAGTMSSGLLAD
jgi:inner membrane protein